MSICARREKERNLTLGVEDAEPRTIKTHLFPANSKVGVKKTMTFKKTGDFAIHLSYRKAGIHAFVPPPSSLSAPLMRRLYSDSEQPDDLFETTITGLTAAFTNLTEEAIANATVKVTIELNESNVVTVNKAVVVLVEEDASAPSLNGSSSSSVPVGR